jgi:crossover junction endodeoxyribonuclease RuvC
LQKTSKIIMGIDPGTLLMGYGIIKVTGSDIVLIEMDVLKLSGKKDNYERLQLINKKITEVVNKYKPHQFAIEAPFFGKNVQSMLKLGRAQGVAIAAAMTLNIPVAEYSPKKVKQSITGNGNADKEQVWKMVQHIFKLIEKPKHFDATDAVAVALCHHYQSKLVSIGSSVLKTKLPVKNKKTDWGSFAANNPGRVVKKK